MQATPQVVRALEHLLKKECRLYAEYLDLLSEERKCLTKFDADKVTQSTLQRAECFEAMRAAQDERLEIMRGFPESKGVPLRRLIQKHFSKAESAQLMPLCEKLLGLAQRTQQQGREHFQILDFGLKVVHGIVSIIWSATQTVVNCYTAKGNLKSSYNPGKSRLSGVLKQA